MTITATVNYHVIRPGRQAFHIDAGGETGKIVSPELAPTTVQLSDLRDPGISVRFETDSVSFATMPSEIHSFDGTGWEPAYEAELRQLLTDQIGAREVIVFDHTVRVDDPNADRRPARNVHSDYSPQGAQERLRDLVGPEAAESWNAGHFAFINIWRPVLHPINSAPLGFVRPSSVAPEDWITLDLIYPDRIGQIMGLVARDPHDWVYLSRMTPDEVAIFNIYDNRGRTSIAHSALDRVEDPDLATPRISLESRTLVRY